MGDSSAGGLASSSLGVMHSADAKSHQNGGNNPAAGNCAKCWTFDTVIRYHHYTNCPHQFKPKLTSSQKEALAHWMPLGTWLAMALFDLLFPVLPMIMVMPPASTSKIYTKMLGPDCCQGGRSLGGSGMLDEGPSDRPTSLMTLPASPRVSRQTS